MPAPPKQGVALYESELVLAGFFQAPISPGNIEDASSLR